MRITGGIASGRRLVSPKSGQQFIRPTSDRVREALFSIVADRTANSKVLDLFAGTGALGLEALSRGAAFAVFIDQSLEAGRLIESNLRSCFPQPQAAFLRLDLTATTNLHPMLSKIAPDQTFDLVFMDPPYQKNLAEQVLAVLVNSNILAPNALIVVEEQKSVQLPAAAGLLTLIDQRRYGETGLWFYQQQPVTSRLHE